MERKDLFSALLSSLSSVLSSLLWWQHFESLGDLQRNCRRVVKIVIGEYQERIMAVEGVGRAMANATTIPCSLSSLQKLETKPGYLQQPTGAELEGKAKLQRSRVCREQKARVACVRSMAREFGKVKPRSSEGSQILGISSPCSCQFSVLFMMIRSFIVAMKPYMWSLVISIIPSVLSFDLVPVYSAEFECQSPWFSETCANFLFLYHSLFGSANFEWVEGLWMIC